MEDMMDFTDAIIDKRASGVLMHISSLPGPYGIGTLGDEAYKFVDFLHDSGQSYWQVLPLGPTGYGDSPYAPFSTFAGNPYFIDLEYLKDDGLLSQEDLNEITDVANSESVDYGLLYQERLGVLYKAFKNFNMESEGYKNFLEENAFWLDNYSLFMSIKENQNSKAWTSWEEMFKFRDEDAIEAFKKVHGGTIDFYNFTQYIFFSQWDKLKMYANSKGIYIIGDITIYVSGDGADTWANPDLFDFDDNLEARTVGGAPPDAFSDDGQLWGDPCYKWDVHEREGFSWWIDRIDWNSTIFDVLRIDHFRGLESYWAVPAGDETARNGEWVDGPGIKLFEAIWDELGEIPIILEDLGFMTDEVKKLREDTAYPGMEVLLFAFDPTSESEYLPHNVVENSVMYIGTHDNATALEWLSHAGQLEADKARIYCGLNAEEGYVWGFIRTAMTSKANTCILQMQDLLGLGENSRMNRPGSTSNNWAWRMKDGMIDDGLARRLRKLTDFTGRNRQADIS